MHAARKHIPSSAAAVTACHVAVRHTGDGRGVGPSSLPASDLSGPINTRRQASARRPDARGRRRHAAWSNYSWSSSATGLYLLTRHMTFSSPLEESSAKLTLMLDCSIRLIKPESAPCSETGLGVSCRQTRIEEYEK